MDVYVVLNLADQKAHENREDERLWRGGSVSYDGAPGRCASFAGLLIAKIV